MPNIKRTMMGAAGGSQPEGLFTWGKRASGRLGIGGSVGGYVSSPVQIGELTTWSDAAAGQRHSAAARTDGRLFTFGNNAYGNLGDGSTTARSSPVQVGALTTWSKVAAGAGFTMSIKTDGLTFDLFVD